MYLKKITLVILLFATLNIVSADVDEEDEFEAEFPCKLFAQTCLDLCLKNDDDITDFSASCDAESSFCKCNDDEITPNVFKKLNELYDDNMELQVEEQNRNVSPVKMLNLVLEEDVEYDELGLMDDYQLDQPENKNDNILEEIQQKELGLNDVDGEDYNEYDEDENGFIYEVEEVHEPALELQEESEIFCPAFIQRCMDDCPTASSRPNCAIDAAATGYFLVCECNGVDISNSVRSQVMAEVFHSPA